MLCRERQGCGGLEVEAFVRASFTLVRQFDGRGGRELQSLLGLRAVARGRLDDLYPAELP